MLKNILTYTYTLIYYCKRFGIRNSLNFFTARDINKKHEFSYRIKGLKYPLYFRRSYSDFTVFQQIFIDRQYNLKLGFIPEVIVDCGANVGFASLYFHSKYPQAQIIAIEPDENNFKQIQKNFRGNKNLTSILGGIWNKTSFLKMEDKYNMGSWGLIATELTSYQEDCVKGYSIGDIMTQFQLTEIDLLKIDIEGSEIELFSSDYENWLPNTKCIIIELHDWLRKDCSKTLFRALLKYDFSISVLGESLVCLRNSLRD